MDEVPVYEIGAYHEVPGHLPLHADVGLLRGGNRGIGRKQLVGGLFGDLNGSHRRVAGVGQLLLLISSDRGQDRHEIGASKQRGSPAEIQRLPSENAGNIGQGIEDRTSQDIMPAEPGRAEQGPLGIQAGLREKVVKNASARANYRFPIARRRPGQTQRRREILPLFACGPQAVGAQDGREQCRFAEVVVLIAVDVPGQPVVQRQALP